MGNLIARTLHNFHCAKSQLSDMRGSHNLITVYFEHIFDVINIKAYHNVQENKHLSLHIMFHDIIIFLCERECPGAVCVKHVGTGTKAWTIKLVTRIIEFELIITLIF